MDSWRCINCKLVVESTIEPKKCGGCYGRTFAHIAPSLTRPTAVSASEVTDAMIEAGVAAFDRTKTLSVRKLLKVAYPAMHAARPTANLGEDGELVARLRATTVEPYATEAAEAADRLILYREALETIRSGVRAMALDAPGRDALTARIDKALGVRR